MSTRGRRAPRAVVDTNILARGLLRPAGSSAALLQAAEDASFQLVLSPSILRELRKVFFKPHVRQRYPLTIEQVAGYMVSLQAIAEVVCRLSRSSTPCVSRKFVMGRAGFPCLGGASPGEVAVA